MAKTAEVAISVVAVVAFLVWALWPRGRNERIFFRRGSLPHSSSEFRNAVGSLITLAWLIWLVVKYPEGILIYLGISGFFWAVIGIVRLINRNRAH
jgi:hypothetical protein